MPDIDPPTASSLWTASIVRPAGVDLISVGWLTHSTPILDIASTIDDRPNALDKMATGRSIRRIHQGSPGKGLRYCWLLRRGDPLNLIQFILA